MPSNVEVVVRYVGVYVCGVIVVSGIARLLVAFWPALHLPALIAWLILILIWTYGAIASVVREFARGSESDHND
jgi:hypothetical protein